MHDAPKREILPLSLAIMFVYNNKLCTDVSSHVRETDLLYYRRKLPS